ncbi:MAG: amidohydrolase [Ruminococcaceae bacterium]|nr:amidohydrolase [Oscillospiraceae bacterium]
MYLDIHTHIYKYPYPRPCSLQMDSRGYFEMFLNEEQMLARHDAMQIDRAVLLPINCPEVYVPQSVGEVIDIARASGGRFIPFCNVDPRVYTNTSDAPLGFLIEHYLKEGCKGVGEVMLPLAFSDPKVQNLLHFCNEFALPVIFHLSALVGHHYGLYDDPGMPQLASCLEKYPDVTFIGHGAAFWSEIGTLRAEEDRIGYPDYPVDGEGSVARLMRTYPNLWLDLSAKSGYNALARDKEYAVGFLNEFADRTMYGTDLCYFKEENRLAALLEGLRDAGRISPATFEKIAYRNAERLLGLL